MPRAKKAAAAAETEIKKAKKTVEEKQTDV